MIKKYQLVNVKRNHYHCSKSGFRAQSLKQGKYFLELMRKSPHSAVYGGSGVLTIPIERFRKLGEPDEVYVEWDGETICVMPRNLKTALDIGFQMKTEKELEGFTPIKQSDFYALHQIQSEDADEIVFVDNEDKETMYKELSQLGLRGIFAKYIKTGKNNFREDEHGAKGLMETETFFIPLLESIPKEDE